MPAGGARSSGIVEATVAAMEQLGAERSRIRAALGPMIRQRNYEVGPDLIARFAAEDPDSRRFFAAPPREGHALFDLAGFIGLQLARAGVQQISKIWDFAPTPIRQRFFSFRRSTHQAEADYGRHVNAIALD